MSLPALTPDRIEEPNVVQEYAEVVSRVAADRRPVILRRAGADLAAVVPLEYFEMVQDVLARQEAERIAAGLDWDTLVKTSPPPQEWFDRDEPKPF